MPAPQQIFAVAQLLLAAFLLLCLPGSISTSTDGDDNHHSGAVAVKRHSPHLLHAYIWADEKPFAVEDAWFTASINISRLFNPKLPIHVITKQAALKHTTAVNRLLQQRVNLRVADEFMQPGTRSARYAANRDLAKAEYPGVTLAQRFCVYADLARTEGHSRVLSLDGDVTLFADLHRSHVFPNTAGYDIVVPTPRCAQMVLWNSLEGLDHFCDFLTDVWVSSNKTWEGHVAMGPTWLHQSDMEILAVFMEHECANKGLKCITLSSITPGHPPNGPNVYDVRYNAMFSLAWMFVNGNASERANMCDDGLPAFNKYATWAHDHRNLPIPLWKATMTHLPVMHFQGDACKHEVLLGIYREHYEPVLQKLRSMPPVLPPIGRHHRRTLALRNH